MRPAGGARSGSRPRARARVLLCAALLAATSCEAGGPSPSGSGTTRLDPSGLPGTPGSSSGTGPTGSGPPTDPPSPPVIELDPLVLTADLSEPPARWDLVASIPFGPAEHQLGLELPPQNTPLPYVPNSFAVGEGGVLSFLDFRKNRVAHYTADGRYVGQTTGLDGDRLHPHGTDLAPSGGRLYLLEQDNFTLSGIVRRGDGLRVGPRVPVSLPDGARPLLSRLVPGARGLVAVLNGYAGTGGHEIGTGPTGAVALLPGAGDQAVREVARPLPGIPLADGTFMGFAQETVDGRATLTHVTSGRSFSRSLQMRVVPEAGAAPFPAAVGWFAVLAVERGLGVFIMLTPAAQENVERHGGGRWYLQISAGGDPLVFERVPETRFADENVVRHVTVGADGGVYLMLVDREGVTVLRR